MLQKRKDSKNRLLKTGESQRKDGRYVYKYVDKFKKTRFVYSWKLVPSDKTPTGKREGLSLREKEMQILSDLADGIFMPKKITVSELYSRQIMQNQNVKPNTVRGRQYLLNIIKNDKLGSCTVDNVKLSDAKEWVIRQKEKGLSYKSIKNYKRSLSSAFNMAVQNDYIRKNPFSFNIKEVIEDNSKTKNALSIEEQRAFLNFVKEDRVYSKNYDEIVVFLETGLRASELCGLTLNDIDMDKRIVFVNHQLLKDSKEGYYISPPKTKSGFRNIYMTNKACTAFKNIIKTMDSRQEFEVQGYRDFLFLNGVGKPKTVADYDSMFRRISKKLSKTCGNKILNMITPHTLRHTFCTNMANAGMNPKSLQYIMGHSSVSMTLNYYSHTSYDFAKKEMERIMG
ncbi:MAG: site-specific integrase [Clostridia bacterium]|nr:site-specific integrase [Clostridia bacterium]